MDLRIEPIDSSHRKAKPEDKALGFGRFFTDHMFTMVYREGHGWHDAAITPYHDFRLDPATMVFHYGQAIFEGLKAYRRPDGRAFLFRPKDNLARMNTTASRMCMATIPVEPVYEAMLRLLDLERDWIPVSRGASLYIRPTMIATEAGLGVRPAASYLFFIILSPVGAYYPEGFNPVKIFVTDRYVRAAPGGVGHVKTAGNYAASIMAAVEAQAQGFTQVLWLDAVHRRYIEEVGTMNIFFLLDDELVTPPLGGSILPGITRDSVIRLAQDWGIKVVERPLAIDEVYAASREGRLREAFGTGTAAVISPVGSLSYQGETCTVNGGQTGPLASRLFETLLGIQYGEEADPHGWTVTF
ncbi:MAG: branched-chain amino acid aminotransferase [Thermodesulfobacteriota bacterium]